VNTAFTVFVDAPFVVSLIYCPEVTKLLVVGTQLSIVAAPDPAFSIVIVSPISVPPFTLAVMIASAPVIPPSIIDVIFVIVPALGATTKHDLLPPDILSSATFRQYVFNSAAVAVIVVPPSDIEVVTSNVPGTTTVSDAVPSAI
jgi:hypothetical protein